MLTLGADTFISIEDANAYFDGHLEKALWDGYGAVKQEAALRGSFARINGACEYAFKADAAPEIVKIAQCEWALELSKQVRKPTKKLKQAIDIKAGPAQMKFESKEDDGYGGVNDWIKKMLSKECQCTFSPKSSTDSVGGSSSIVISY